MDKEIIMEDLVKIELLIVSLNRKLLLPDQELVSKNLHKALENILVAQKRVRVK